MSQVVDYESSCRLYRYARYVKTRVICIGWQKAPQKNKQIGTRRGFIQVSVYTESLLLETLYAIKWSLRSSLKVSR